VVRGRVSEGATCQAAAAAELQACLTDQSCIALPAVVDQALAHFLVDMGAEVVGTHLRHKQQRMVQSHAACLVRADACRIQYVLLLHWAWHTGRQYALLIAAFALSTATSSNSSALLSTQAKGVTPFKGQVGLLTTPCSAPPVWWCRVRSSGRRTRAGRFC
jgi:hypothetical protein